MINLKKNNFLYFSKSTLLKLLRGEIQPTSGELIRNRFVRFGNFDQHSGDQFDLEITPVEHLRVSFCFCFFLQNETFLYIYFVFRLETLRFGLSRMSKTFRFSWFTRFWT
jgi:hypothetical protein